MNKLFALPALVALSSLAAPADACCAAPPSGKAVVNADQTVILVWDPATKTEHFVRRASFKSEADDFGFIVPTPAQPELAESGDDAFPMLARITAPEIKRMAAPSSGGCAGCSRSKAATASAPEPKSAVVLEEKTVAGFHAVVLEADTTTALTAWLKDHQYAFSPEVEAWAKPYVDQKWKFTALKVAKDPSGKDNQGVAAASLRISFKTDRLLFPYREPDSGKAAAAVGASSRLLRFFVIADARFDGALTGGRWTGTTAWSNEMKAEDRVKALELLRLPAQAAPAKAWLTELEDPWPYRPAPSDLYFAKSATQDVVKREPIIEYYTDNGTDHDATWLAGLVIVPLLFRRRVD